MSESLTAREGHQLHDDCVARVAAEAQHWKAMAEDGGRTIQTLIGKLAAAQAEVGRLARDRDVWEAHARDLEHPNDDEQKLCLASPEICSSPDCARCSETCTDPRCQGPHQRIKLPTCPKYLTDDSSLESYQAAMKQLGDETWEEASAREDAAAALLFGETKGEPDAVQS